jgi:hypothetical protein
MDLINLSLDGNRWIETISFKILKKMVISVGYLVVGIILLKQTYKMLDTMF